MTLNRAISPTPERLPPIVRKLKPKRYGDVFIILSVLMVMSMIISAPAEHTLRRDGNEWAGSSGYKTVGGCSEYQSFEAYSTGQTDIGVNWSYKPVGLQSGLDAEICIDSIIVKAGSNSLQIDSPVVGCGIMQHNLTVPQNSGVANYSFWYYPHSDGVLYYLTLTNYAIGAATGDVSETIMLTTDYGNPEVYIQDSGSNFQYVGLYTNDAWNAMMLSINLTTGMAGVASNDSAMPTEPTIWVPMLGALVFPINDFQIWIMDSISSLYIDEFRTQTTTPIITSGIPYGYANGTDTYYYNATSTIKDYSAASLNWSMDSNCSWLGFTEDPNGTTFCNVSGIAPELWFNSTYWVNLTVNDTDSFDYINWTFNLNYTPGVGPPIPPGPPSFFAVMIPLAVTFFVIGVIMKMMRRMRP